MKRAALILIVATQVCLSQTVTIHHTFYTTTFDKTLRVPLVVKWWLTKSMLKCSKAVSRKGYKFAADPQLADLTKLAGDYSGSGYDRGHNMPAAANQCSKIGMKECFYFSNMCPQTKELNRIKWERLEAYERTLAQSNDSILIWCGSVCTSGKTIGKDKVAVPDYCWKILYIKKSGETHYYSFRNDHSAAMPIAKYEVSADSLVHLTGLKFEASN